MFVSTPEISPILDGQKISTILQTQTYFNEQFISFLILAFEF